MEAYIRNELSVSSDLTLDEAATHSVKLLQWLLDVEDQMQETQLELCYADIECMFKAMLYLFECHTRHGDELVDAVLQQCNDSAPARSFYANSETDRAQCIQALCVRIVNGTREGHKWAPILHHMHKAYADVQPGWSSIKELNWPLALEESNKRNQTLDVANMDLNMDVLRMRALVRRIFRLPSVQQMQTALERGMQQLDTELWLQLFREPKQSIVYTRCRLLRQLVCDLLAEGVTNANPATASFMHNIYSFVAEGNTTNVARLLRSLMHVRFASGLSSYLLAYWTQQLPYLQLDDDMQLAEEAPVLPAVPLEEMLYLTHLLLSPKSPCRAQFYGALRSLPMLQRLRDLLNKVAYGYS
ncbi:hypothetical protein KR215_009984 [Drosophila sulfurigaster]|nr:hypothetical protein KR215_009984 [Drosophila sulfurigaster]